MNGNHRYDDLEQVVVERAQELRPEEGLQPTMFKRVAVAMRGHVTLSLTARYRYPESRS